MTLVNCVEPWEMMPSIMELRSENPVRFHTMKILEENPDGLLVVQIQNRLREVGFNLSQPAVSKHLAVLKGMSLIGEFERRDERLQRRVHYYRSLASLYVNLKYRIINNISAPFADAIQEMGDELPIFKNIFDLQNFLTNVAEEVGGSISVSNELYTELSTRTPYGEMIKLLWEHQDIVSHIEVAITNLNYLEKVTSSLRLDFKDSYDLAMGLIGEALSGNRYAFGILEELHRGSREPLKQALAKALKFVEKHQGDRRLIT